MDGGDLDDGWTTTDELALRGKGGGGMLLLPLVLVPTLPFSSNAPTSPLTCAPLPSGGDEDDSCDEAGSGGGGGCWCWC